MSENVEVVRRSIDAFNRGDLEAFRANLHAEVEAIDDPRVPGARKLRGHAEVERYFESLSSYWESPRLVPERFVDRNDDVFVFGRMIARNRRGGPEIERTLDQVVTLRNGKLVRGRVFSSREEALEAAGLEE